MAFFRGMSAFKTSWHNFVKAVPVLKHTISALYWLPIGIIVNEHLFTIKLVSGRSMQPTLNPDSSQWRDVAIFDRFSIGTLRQYNRGDIVALWSPVEPKLLIKRIIALEGDIVKTLPPYPDGEVRIPVGSMWVEGDEPFRTDDSNRFGPVPLALLDSKLSFIVWPFERWGPIHEPSVSTSQMGVPRGPAWRRNMAEVEREKWRKSRVRISQGKDCID